tara:strand:+ start:1906 stop:2214 length:309 start_codon:yes stop_codon:yes gene_type:complete
MLTRFMQNQADVMQGEKPATGLAGIMQRGVGRTVGQLQNVKDRQDAQNAARNAQDPTTPPPLPQNRPDASLGSQIDQALGGMNPSQRATLTNQIQQVLGGNS